MCIFISISNRKWNNLLQLPLVKAFCQQIIENCCRDDDAMINDRIKRHIFFVNRKRRYFMYLLVWVACILLERNLHVHSLDTRPVSKGLVIFLLPHSNENLCTSNHTYFSRQVRPLQQIESRIRSILV